MTRRLAPDPSGDKRLEPGPRGSCNPVDRGRPPTVLAPARGETRAGRPLSIESPIPSDAEVAGACPIDRPLLVGGESDFFVDRSRWLLAPPTGDGRGGAVSGRGMEVRNTPFPDDAGGCPSRSSTPGSSSGSSPFPWPGFPCPFLGFPSEDSARSSSPVPAPFSSGRDGEGVPTRGPLSPGSGCFNSALPGSGGFPAVTRLPSWSWRRNFCGWAFSPIKMFSAMSTRKLGSLMAASAGPGAIAPLLGSGTKHSPTFDLGCRELATVTRTDLPVSPVDHGRQGTEEQQEEYGDNAYTNQDAA